MFADLAYRLRALFRRPSVEAEMDAELGAHLEQQREKYVRAGLPVDEARRRARLDLGGLEQVKEECREARGVLLIEELLRDIRYGVRQLRRNPGFAAMAVLTLALGIGANTAIFSLIDAVMFKMLPVRQPEQLVVLNWASQGRPYFIHGIDGHQDRDKNGHRRSTAFSYPVFEAIRARNHVFSSLCAFYGGDSFYVSAGGQVAVAPGEFVSRAYFSTLGIRPTIGRLLTAADDSENASRAAVISYSYWMHRFGGDPSVIGSAITVGGVPFTLVGVAAPKFSGLQPGQPVDVWIPLRTQPLVDRDWFWIPKGRSIFSTGQEWWLVVVGRLRPGVTKQHANAQVTAILEQATAGIEKPPSRRLPDVSLKAPRVELVSAANGLSALREHFSRPLFVLMAVVVLVLLIACANVASLLLARSASRRREIGVRLALGASRRRLIRQLLTESLLLSASGGFFGVILAYWASAALVTFLTKSGRLVQLHVSPDLRVLGFAAFVSILTGILFGLAPAVGGTGLQPAPALKDGGGGAIGPARSAREVGPGLRECLVTSQIAVSLLLLIGAGLFVRSLTDLVHQNLGFNHRNLLTFQIDPTEGGYKGERLANFYGELQRRIEAVPGVISASLCRHFLVNGGYWGTGVSIQGYTPKPGDTNDNGSIDTYADSVGSRFFETYGIPLVLGRTIRDEDVEGSPKVGVINEAFARKYFRNTNPIGRRFGFGLAKNSSDIAIVGVVGNATYGDLREPPPPTVYVPYAQKLDNLGAMNFEVRTAGDPKNWIGAVRQTVQKLDRTLALANVATESEEIEQATFQEHLFADLTSLFGLLALALACIGLYGVMAYAVVQRTNEIGVRMALGARPSNILRMILWRGAKLTVIGVAIGVFGALATTRLIASFLFGVAPRDSLTFTGAAAMMTLVALLASYIPAWRAAAVDPMEALRYE